MRIASCGPCWYPHPLSGMSGSGRLRSRVCGSSRAGFREAEIRKRRSRKGHSGDEAMATGPYHATFLAQLLVLLADCAVIALLMAIGTPWTILVAIALIIFIDLACEALEIVRIGGCLVNAIGK